MRVLFFGRYDPHYSRNHVFLRGLASQGITVTECRVDPSSRWWPLKLMWRYLRMRPRFNVMLVPFSGQEVMLVARWLTRKPIIFDAFSSHYGGYILDRAKASPQSIRARWYRLVDRWSCRLADHVLLDTQAHIDFFVREFHLSAEKFSRVFVGTDSRLFPFQPEPAGPFTVHFHGSFIPLQGVRTILDAAALLKDEGVRFLVTGSGQTFRADRAYADQLELHNVSFLGRIPYPQLYERIAQGHVSLGIFGTTPKTKLVIPNKVYEALAVGRAVITADTPAIRELLDERDAVLIGAGDAQALARAIVRLRDDPARRHALLTHGHETFLAQAVPEVIGAQLKGMMHVYAKAN